MLRNWLRSGQVQEPAPAVSNAIAEDMANEEQQALTTQIDTWERRQWALQERQAQQGISTPPEVTIEIADITTKLGELKSELNRLRRR
jgi:flagellar basal body rod protein FlgC